MDKQQLDDNRLKFLIDDYKTKVLHLDTQYGRMWSRFNYFLTIQAGLFILLFSPLAGPERAARAILITPIGIIWCVVWYIFGAQDRYHVATQRKIIEHTVQQIHTKLQLTNQYYAGQTANTKALAVPKSVYQWRIEWLSVSKLPAMCPVIVMLIWIFVFTMTRNG